MGTRFLPPRSTLPAARQVPAHAWRSSATSCLLRSLRAGAQNLGGLSRQPGGSLLSSLPCPT